MSSLPISDHALLSDCHSAALVSRAGSIEWLCFPRFDAPSVFARLLDEGGGHWRLGPVEGLPVSRRYRGRTLILETTFRAAHGTAVLEDALALGAGTRGHQLGEGAPHALLRRLRCMSGEVDVELEYAPRPEYGLVQPLLARTEHGISGRGGPDHLLLSSPVRLSVEGGTARGRFRLRAGQSVAFALQRRASWEAPPRPWSQEQIHQHLEDTAESWCSWSDMHQRYDGPWRELVHQSGRVLQALTFQPTGAIIAAPTTSLPEAPGGERNWDYRYTWVRDTSLTLEALWVAACPDEAHRYFDFLTGAALTRLRGGAELPIMFGVGGEHDLPERELPQLAGWRQSRPVRVGNGAWTQRQLDVYGELLGAAWRLRDQLDRLDETGREFLIEVADTAAARWREMDHGLWEIRGQQRHYVHSKLMSWVALDRALRMADFLGARARVERWREVREELRRAILEQGWSERAGAFVQAFGSEELDAACLLMPIVGFLPASEPRMRATLDAISERLTDARGLVYRYRMDDELKGEEGTFLLCTFWLAEAWALAGELERARETFERAAAFANDVGLLSEEVDADTGELLGNFPQAFSHIGLVNAAWAISNAERHGSRPAPSPEEAPLGLS